MSLSFVSILSSAVLVTNVALAADAGHGQQASDITRAGHGSAIMVADASNVRTSQPGAEKSIIIVSGKQSRAGWTASRGSNVTPNPHPLPPRQSVETSINSKASHVMLNPQPLPPKAR